VPATLPLYLSRVLREHLDVGLPMSSDWMRVPDKNAFDLPGLCEQFSLRSPAARTCIVLRGAYEGHLRGLRLGVRSCGAM